MHWGLYPMKLRLNRAISNSIQVTTFNSPVWHPPEQSASRIHLLAPCSLFDLLKLFLLAVITNPFLLSWIANSLPNDETKQRVDEKVPQQLWIERNSLDLMRFPAGGSPYANETDS
ncbi:hypothetical protein RSAG8_13688, partial [Rhizoctonia solani AG-8 WAC10335]